jgi:hypothetical protein
MSLRLVSWATCALVIALGAGWMWGASGKAAIEEQRRMLIERADLAEARALVLDGRVSLFLLNFGDAGQRFEQAQRIVAQIQVRLRETGQAERAGRVEIVLAHLKDAQRLAAAVDQNAQGAAEAALQALSALAPAGRP